ncbi:MAG: DNA alkylation repair protein [Rubripirellula sp.]
MANCEVQSITRELQTLADPSIAEHAQRFFKSAPGEYGAGDTFLGIRVPDLRRLSRKNRQLDVGDVLQLLHSPAHETRLLAVFILVLKYERGDDADRKLVFDAYCENLDFVNNWDLVDASAYKIVGAHLQDRDRRLLRRLAKSKDLWRRRVAIISTFAFIREHDFDETLFLSQRLLRDPEDLIHKAVGWMLREVGNRDRTIEEHFLKAHYNEMPRTMLRYAIEKFPESTRQRYLKGKI